MNLGTYRDNRSLNSITLGDLIGQYSKQVSAVRLFGKNNAVVLESMTGALGVFRFTPCTPKAQASTSTPGVLTAPLADRD